MGVEKFSQFQSAYWIEKALSVDNLFVFILVFGFFNVPKENHHKVLFWGIIGALVLRAVFIFSGVGLIKLTYLPKMELFWAYCEYKCYPYLVWYIPYLCRDQIMVCRR